MQKWHIACSVAVLENAHCNIVGYAKWADVLRLRKTPINADIRIWYKKAEFLRWSKDCFKYYSKIYLVPTLGTLI